MQQKNEKLIIPSSKILNRVNKKEQQKKQDKKYKTE